MKKLFLLLVILFGVNSSFASVPSNKAVLRIIGWQETPTKFYKAYGQSTGADDMSQLLTDLYYLHNDASKNFANDALKGVLGALADEVFNVKNVDSAEKFQNAMKTFFRTSSKVNQSSLNKLVGGFKFFKAKADAKAAAEKLKSASSEKEVRALLKNMFDASVESLNGASLLFDKRPAKEIVKAVKEAERAFTVNENYKVGASALNKTLSIILKPEVSFELIKQYKDSFADFIIFVSGDDVVKINKALGPLSEKVFGDGKPKGIKLNEAMWTNIAKGMLVGIDGAMRGMAARARASASTATTSTTTSTGSSA